MISTKGGSDLSFRQQSQLRVLLAARSVLGALPISGKRTLSGYLTRALAPDLGQVTVNVRGYNISLNLKDRVQRWMVFNLYDPDETALLGKLLAPGSCFLDIGANVGWYTLCAAPLVGSTGQVHSFEPVPWNVQALQATLDRNKLGWVQLVPAAVSDGPGELPLHLPASAGESGWATAVPIDGGTTITVQCIAVDDYLAGLADPPARVALAKLDIEGYEPMALRGMQKTLDRDHPDLIVEINRPMLTRAGFSVREMGEILKLHGYRTWLIDRGSKLQPYDFSDENFEVINLLASVRDVPL